MAAANPYMRDALIDGMQEDVESQRPTGKSGLPPGYVQPGFSGGPPPPPGTNYVEGGPPVSTTPTQPDGKVETPAPATAPTNSNSAVPQGANTNKAYAGFNTQRTQDPTKSAKDAFLAASQGAEWMPNSKAEAEQWFNQYIKQALIDQGYGVDWVQGDKAFVRTKENPGGEEIDFLQQAGAPDAALAWQSNMAGMNTAGGSTGSTGITSPTLNPALSNNSVLDQINAQIASLMGAGLNLDQIRELINTGAGGEQGTGMTPQV